MSEHPPNAIAIVGMACRFPGADSPQDFWHKLAGGVESIRRFSREELLAAGWPPTLIDHPNFVSAHGALDDIAAFDAELFGYTSSEAALIDPQHRLLLECAWAALEDADIDPSRITPGNNLTGVFAGCGLPAYLLQQVYPSLDTTDPGAVYQAMLGNDKDFLAARIAYKLNLGGPAMTIQAACATSLICVHTACQSLLNGECDSALAGGVSLRIPQAGGHLYQQGGIHSADGCCRAFDAAADGTVSGSGAGLVVLQRLDDALAAGHRIHAIILGSAVNNDGAQKMSFTAPGVAGQTAVIREALAVAGVTPDSIGYVEAHGTGTALGDPIEIAALSQAFGKSASNARCLIGSVKTNIGHLDAAAGIAGLIKTVLALRQRAIPPSLNFCSGNPNIDFAGGRFQVCRALTPWPDSATPRRAGVSSFGLGGNNAHLILEEAPAAAKSSTAMAAGWQLYPISAQTTAARQARVRQLGEYLRGCEKILHPTAKTQRDTEVADTDDAAALAWTLSAGRATLPEAGFVVADSPASLCQALQNGRLTTGRRPAQAPRIAFLYPGQGAQQVGAGRQLYQNDPVFRAALDRCAEALHAAGLADVREILLAAPSPALENQARETQHAQALIFALSYALTALWRQCGIEPAAVLGHSSGEYAAAVTAGLLTLPDAARALAARARLMAGMPAGGMTAVGLSESELAALLPAGLSIAAINGPALCTVAGDLASLSEFEQQLAPRGTLLHRLQTAHAFHTPAADCVLPAFRQALADIPLQAPTLPFYSALLGQRAQPAQITERELWVSQIRQPVRFAPALAALRSDGCSVLLEVGPGSTLATLASLAPDSAQSTIIPGLPRNGDERREVLDGLGQLWLAGATPDWNQLFAAPPRRIALPTYPFARTRHWIDRQPAGATSHSQAPAADTLPDNTIQLLAPTWQRAAPLPAARSSAQPSRWLVFSEADNAVCEQLIGKLRQAGDAVTVARPAAQRCQQNDEWLIAPRHDADYRHLLQQTGPERIVYAWQFPQTAETPAIPAGTPACLDSFFRLLRAIAVDGKNLQEIVIVTRGALDITGSEDLQAAQASLIGPLRVVPLEFPGIRCRLLDITDDLPADRLGAAIAGELADSAAAPLTALRGGHRWLPSQLLLQHQPIPTTFRPQGIYLITGGLGGIGLAIAEHLARQTQVRLALISRTPLPPAADWTDWLTHHPDDAPITRTVQKLRELQALGSAVQVFAADSSDLAAMTRVITTIRQTWGEPNGVIHAAGVAGGGVIAQRSDSDIAAVLQPKIAGTEALLTALGAIAPDFLLLFSSINTLSPVAGQADYAAANAYLENRAAQLRRQDWPATAINWDAWRDVGMAASSQLPATLAASRKAELARYGLSTHDACQALSDILSANCAQVIVTTPQRRHDLQQPSHREQAADLASADTLPIIDHLGQIWQNLLGIPSVAPDDDFFQLGGHSLLAIRVGFQIRQCWNCTVSIGDIFANPTLAALATLIETRTKTDDDEELILI